MRNLFPFPLLLLLAPALVGQNLLKNPGFETLQPGGIVVPCIFVMHSADFTSNIASWKTFRGMTPDHNRAGETCDLFPSVHGGEYCVGLITYLPAEDLDGTNNYREIIEGKLSTPLYPGKKYKIELWVREDEAIIRRHLAKVYAGNTPVQPVHAGNLGLWFRPETASDFDSFKETRGGVRIRPQIVFKEPIVTKGAWVKLEATFVPDQYVQYLLIGNFSSDALTPTDLPAAEHERIKAANAKAGSIVDRIKRCAYLCIDDISITLDEPPPAAKTEKTKPPTLEESLLKDKKFTFSAGVLFDVDKAELKPEAFPALDSLVVFLKKFPKRRLGISGHTDDSGSEEHNMELSGRRAKAVLEYLRQKEIPESRLEWRAFGESKPVADNASEAGKQQNRRVECLLLE